MIYLRSQIKWIFVFNFLMLVSCIEEFTPETVEFEDLLVVKATLTDELKYHEVELSRSFRFGEASGMVTGASVQIVDDTQNTYAYNEVETGKYVSINQFRAEADRLYTLQITTANNVTYSSSAEKLPSNTAQVTDVSFINAVNNEEEGINILVDSFDPMGNARYYRYEFEETQRIVAPFSGSQEIVIVSDVPPFKVENIPLTKERRTCYKTTISNSEIVQTETNGLSEDRVTQFPVKFIHKRDSVIRDRYSILVKQHVQSLGAYSYFKTLDEFNSSENVFSENQPGFIESNISSNRGVDGKVLGFFEINSVSSKRLFVSYEEAFPGENTLPYFSDCVTSKPLLVDPNNPNVSPLIDLVKAGRVVYLFRNEDFFGNNIENPPYEVVNRECGDCTFYGSNVKPEFWID